MIAVVDYAKGNLQSVVRGLQAAGADDVHVVVGSDDIAAADAVVLPGVGAFADASAFMLQSGQMAAVRAAIHAHKPFLGICLGLHLLFDAGTEGAPASGPLPRGLGVIPGVCYRLPNTDDAGSAYKVPHMGWNSVDSAALPNGGISFGTRGEKAGQSGVPGEPSPTGVDLGHPAAELSPTGVGLGVPANEPSLTGVDLGHPAAEWSSCPLLRGIAPGEHFYFTHSYVAPKNCFTQATATHSITFPCLVEVDRTCFGVQFHPEKSSEAGLSVLRNFVDLVREAARP